jgi:hypothetical protein
MVRWLLCAMALAWVMAPAHAFTEQEVVDRFGDDLAGAVGSLHRVIPTQQLTLTASLDLAGDKAQLDTNLALRALAADLAIASANLSLADKDTATVARQQYLNDLSQACAKYQQSVAQAYSGWTNRAAEAYQTAQQNGPPGLQAGLQALVVAQQRAMQSVAGSDWGDDAPVVAPTLPDLTGRVNEDAERLAEAASLIAQARQSYLVDVNGLQGTCDASLEAAVLLDDRHAITDAMAAAVRDLNEASCQRYRQYDTDVRQVLGALCQTCGTP